MICFRLGGFDETGKGTPEDLIFFYHHLDLGGKINRVDEILLIYRYHPLQTTFSVDELVNLCKFNLTIGFIIYFLMIVIKESYLELVFGAIRKDSTTKVERRIYDLERWKTGSSTLQIVARKISVQSLKLL